MKARYVVKATDGSHDPYMIDGSTMEFGTQSKARRFESMWAAVEYVFQHGWTADDNGLRVIRLKRRKRAVAR